MLLVNGKRKEDLPKLAKSVEFRLLNGTYEDPRVMDAQGNKRVRKNLIYRIPTVYVKFVKELNQNVEYRYAVQEIPIKTGKEEGTKRYTPDKIVFTSTTLVVTPAQPDLYEFLKNSPWVEKEGNSRALFKEMNPINDSQSRLDKEALKIKAKRLILEEDALPEITLRRILESTGDNGEYDMSVVRDKLLNVAEKDPKTFLNSVGSKDTELKALITELSNKKYIGFNPDRKQWQWGEATKDKGNTIVACPAGKNETDWLIDTLFREEQLLKSFKLLSKEKPIDQTKGDERLNIEAKAKKLKCAQGMAFMSDEKLQAKIDATITALKKEMDNVKTTESRKSAIERILSEVGELVTVN